MTFTEIDIAWATGLFEGEGCFSFYKGKSNPRRITARLTTTDLDVLERFKSVCFGLGKIYGPTLKDTNKPYWTWTTTTFEEAQAVIALFWKHLGLRRKVKAREILSQYLNTPTRKRTKFSLSPRCNNTILKQMQNLATAGKTQKEIAKETQRSQSSVSRLLSGNRKVKG